VKYVICIYLVIMFKIVGLIFLKREICVFFCVTLEAGEVYVVLI